MSKVAKKPITQIEPKQRFFAMVKHPRAAGDHWDPFQIEVVVFRGDKLTHRYFFDKRDHKQMIAAKLEMIDSVTEAEFEKYES